MKTRKLLTAVIAFLAFALTTLAQTTISSSPPPPGCGDPYNLTVTATTTSTANLSWTSDGQIIPWEIEVIPATATPTGMGIVYNGLLPYFVSGLSPATAYLYYVRSSCGFESTWIGPYQFVTLPIVANTQTLCTKTIQPYNVNVGDATHDGSTYAWSISPTTPSAVMTGNGTNSITIDWTNAPNGTYTLQAIETNAAGCVSTAVSATINLSTTPAAPAAPATQTFCTASTVTNLTATGTNLQWFDVATGGTALASTTALVTGTTYYVSQTTGTCESARTAVAVTISPLTAPTAVAQTFCTSATVANLVATGTAIKWYAALTGGTALASTTALVTGTTYYVSQTTSTCESTRTAVAVTITPLAAPTASAQTFCNSATVANLVATGTALKWYAALTGGTALANTTALVTGTTYYASQTVGTCESTRTAVAVTITPRTTPTFTQVAPICAGAILAALPTTSTNGVTGTWSPTINNTTTTTYTFTPNAGLCANTATMTITVNPIVTPTFTTVASSCANATLAALPTTSNNGISGTWSPALNNTTTTTYTFTPNAGQCANTTTQTITITAPKVTSAISFTAPAAALPSVTIGTQVWTNKNLDVTTYRDGTPIPQVTDPTAWANLTTGAWCYYNNDPANGAIYGKLYNWYAVAGIHDNDPNTPNKILAPLGWHVPTDGEWTTLTTFLGGLDVAGQQMKEIGNLHWVNSNTIGTNFSGFTGLPGGLRAGQDGTFFAFGSHGHWWSSSAYDAANAWYRVLSYNYAYGIRGSDRKGHGMSMRLVKD